MGFDYNSFKSGHEALSNTLDNIEKYQRYLPAIEGAIGVLTQYIADLQSENQEISKEIEDLKKDPDIFKEIKNLLASLGVDAADSIQHIATTFLDYAKSKMEEEVSDIVAKYKKNLMADTLKGLTTVGILPALIYNHLIESINNELAYASGLLTSISAHIDVILSAYSDLNLLGNKEDIRRLLDYASANIKKDLDINTHIWSYLKSSNINGLTDELLSQHNKYFKLAMEALYPGSMSTDPEMGEEFTNYKYIYRGGIGLDALKASYESTALSHDFAVYKGFLSILLTRIEELDELLGEYNKTYYAISANIDNLNKLKGVVEKYSKQKNNVIVHLLSSVESAFEHRMGYDRSALIDIKNIAGKDILHIESFRYTKAVDMLKELKEDTSVNILQNTNITTVLLTLLSEKNILSIYRLHTIKNKLSTYVSMMLSFSASAQQLKKLKKTLGDLKNSAIFNLNQVRLIKADMKQYKEIELNTLTCGLQPIETFLTDIDAAESLSALYAGDIERGIELLTSVRNTALSLMPPSLQNRLVNIGLLKASVDAKDKATKTMKLDSLKLQKMAGLSQRVEKNKDKLKKAKDLLQNIKGEIK